MEKVFKDTELAYIAGIIDGDGSFSLIKRLRERDRFPLYRTYVQFMKSNEEICKYLKDSFGGNLTKKKIKPIDGVDRYCYAWRLDSNPSAHPFLEKVVPYLIIKKERAAFLKKYIEDNPYKRGNVITAEISLKRESAHLKMKSFNSNRNLTKKVPDVRHRVNTGSELFWAYLAGLIDTDGSFSVKREKPARESIDYRYGPIISLTLIGYEAMEYILQNCSVGSVYVIGANASTQGFCYRFTMYSKEDCKTFLQRTIPYLRIKKQQAEILLNFCENFVPQYGQYLKTKEQSNFREDCYQRIKQLNANGVVKSSLIDLELLPDSAGDDKGQAAKAGSLNDLAGGSLEIESAKVCS